MDTLVLIGLGALILSDGRKQAPVAQQPKPQPQPDMSGLDSMAREWALFVAEQTANAIKEL